MFAVSAAGDGFGAPLVEPIESYIDPLREKDLISVLDGENPAPRPRILLVAGLVRAFDGLGRGQQHRARVMSAVARGGMRAA
jgi:hypothetical protein